MSHVHAFVLFLSTLKMCFFLFSLSLFLDRLHYGIQTEKIHSGSEPSLRFQVILFISSVCSISYLVPWWEGQEGLLWELPGSWRSSKMPVHSIGFLWHNATQCHSNSRMGISMWETLPLSRRVYTGVLLQHTWHRHLCASVRYMIQRYVYSGYPRSCCRGTTCP